MRADPLLFKQALSFTKTGSAEHARFAKVLGAVEQTLALINEDVRAKEAQVRMKDVLEVRGGMSVKNLLATPRKLELELAVDMKCASKWLQPEWRVRRGYRWFVFSDIVLVCNRTLNPLQGLVKKLIINLDGARVSTSDTLGYYAVPEMKLSISGLSRSTEPATEPATERATAPGDHDARRWHDFRPAMGTMEHRRNSAWPQLWRATESQMEVDDRVIKPEVFFLKSEEEVFKCWATTETDKDTLVELLLRLQQKRVDASHDLEQRRSQVELSPPRHNSFTDV